MAESLVLILRILGVALGVLFISTRLLYKTEQGHLQSKLQDLWITIDDLQKYALSRHTAFMRVMAAILNSLFNRIFGKRLISLQSITVSVCYAVVSVVTVLMLGKLYLNRDAGSFLPSVLLAYLLVGTTPLLVTLIKGRAKQKKYLLVWQTVSLTFALLNIVVPFVEAAKLFYSPEDKYLFSLFMLIGLGIILALGIYAAFVMVARISLRWLADSESITKIVLISLLNIVPALILYVLFKLTVLRLEHSNLGANINTETPEQVKSMLIDWGAQIDLAMFITMLFIFLMGIVFIIPALLFLSLSLIMIIHRVLWPLIHRPLYKLQELEITSRNNLLTIVGVVLIVISLGLYEWLQAAIKLLL
jgi:hypothetical protein